MQAPARRRNQCAAGMTWRLTSQHLAYPHRVAPIPNWPYGQTAVQQRLVWPAGPSPARCAVCRLAPAREAKPSQAQPSPALAECSPPATCLAEAVEWPLAAPVAGGPKRQADDQGQRAHGLIYPEGPPHLLRGTARQQSQGGSGYKPGGASPRPLCNARRRSGDERTRLHSPARGPRFPGTYCATLTCSAGRGIVPQPSEVGPVLLLLNPACPASQRKLL